MITNEFSGRKYGKLFLEYELEQRGYSRYYQCTCECGIKKSVRLSHMQSGKTVSCGCHRRYMTTTYRTDLDFIVSNTRIYKIWVAMKQRCNNQNNTAYEYYGGRGISLCKEWEHFKNFYEWAVDNGYNDELTINRINSCNNYEPNNCEWITNSENVSLMANEHRINNTGAFSQEIFDDITETNRNKLGAKFLMKTSEMSIEFRCLIEAAEYIISHKNLTTDPKQIRKNISACLHKKRKTCHGFTFERIDQ